MNDEKDVEQWEEIWDLPDEDPGPSGVAIAFCAMAVLMIVGLISMWFFVQALAALIGYPLASIAFLGSAFGGVVYWSLDLTAG